MMPQWVGVVLVIVTALVLLWVILFLIGWLSTDDLWEATVAATRLMAFLAGIAVVTVAAGALFAWGYRVFGLGT